MECPLCLSAVTIKYQKHPSYVKDLFFDIVHCDHCNTSFASPRNIDISLYAQIYNNPSQVPGYDRYSQIGDIILEKKSPLNFLKKHSLEYWFIISELKKCYKKDNMILEVGCGIGYLTYALNHAGFNTVGSDIADNVIDKAIQLFGPYYQKGGVEALLFKNLKFDFIILTEVIEHIPEPIDFLKKLKLLLNENGIIFLTTPNKSAFSKDALWLTDAPPIHLWWFSERSIYRVADEIKMECKIIKTNGCHENSYYYLEKSAKIDKPVFIPSLINTKELYNDENIKSLEIIKFIKRIIFKGIKELLCMLPFKNRIIRIRNKFMKNHKSEIPHTLCAKLINR